MVTKKSVDRVDKFFIIGFLVLISLGFIMAVGTIEFVNNGTSFLSYGNYSTTINISLNLTMFNVTPGWAFNYNVTILYNTTGAAANGTALLTIWNTTVDQAFWENASVNIAGLPDGNQSYNFTVKADNWTDHAYLVVAVRNITIDNTPPAVNFSGAGISSALSNGNYSGALVINASAGDVLMGLSSIYLNITNSTGDVNFTSASSSVASFYNISIVTTGFPDGKYNITIWANDTLNNLNNTEKIQITIDNTAPTGTVACTPANVQAGNTVTCTCSPSDALAGINATATSITATPSTSNTGTQTSTCSFADLAGNTGSASGTYVVELGSSSSSSGSSGSSTTSTFSYSKTIPQTSQDFSEVKIIETSTFSGGGLGARERVKIKINDEEHHIGVKQLTTEKATIEIASDPIEVELAVGDDAKVDVDADSFYDIYVKLNGIVSNKADITIEYLHEALPEGTSGSVETSGEVVGEGSSGAQGATPESTSLTWLWIVLGIILIGAVVWFILNKKE